MLERRRASSANNTASHSEDKLPRHATVSRALLFSSSRNAASYEKRAQYLFSLGVVGVFLLILSSISLLTRTPEDPAFVHHSDIIDPSNGRHSRLTLRRVNPLFSRHRNLSPIRNSQPWFNPAAGEAAEVGEKSAWYKSLRQDYDKAWIPDTDVGRRLELIKSFRKRTYYPISDFDNDADCPLYPAKDYPKGWPILDIVDNWNPDDTTPHEAIYQGICVFDYEKDRAKIENYRRAELPFVIRNDPQVLKTVERWTHPTYLKNLLGNELHRTEYSKTNHFMYWSNPRNRRGLEPEGWKPPTEVTQMTYEDWLTNANTTDDKLGPEQDHWYFRLIGCGGYKDCDKQSSEFLFDELPYFRPKESLYIVDPDQQKGKHCVFVILGTSFSYALI